MGDLFVFLHADIVVAIVGTKLKGASYENTGHRWQWLYWFAHCG